MFDLNAFAPDFESIHTHVFYEHAFGRHESVSHPIGEKQKYKMVKLALEVGCRRIWGKDVKAGIPILYLCLLL